MPTDYFLLREVFSFCHEFTLILKSKWKDLNSRLGGCRIYVSEIYFSNFLKNKEGEKDWSDPQPDSTIQPKARGLLHMEREYFAHHIWSRFRGLSTSQPRSNHEYFEDYSAHQKEDSEATRGCSDYLKYSKTPSKYSTPAGLGYEELGGLSDPGQRDCSQA